MTWQSGGQSGGQNPPQDQPGQQPPTVRYPVGYGQFPPPPQPGQQPPAARGRYQAPPGQYQGGYGQFPPPRYGQPQAPPEPPRTGKPNNRLVIVTIAVVLVGLGVGIFLALPKSGGSASGGGGSGGGGGSMKVAWAVMPPSGTSRLAGGLGGSWATAQAVVDGRGDGLIAYALSNGAQSWSFQAPAGDTGCDMSATTANGIGVFAYGADAQHCDHLVAINVATGQRVWPHPDVINDTGPAGGLRNPDIAISGTTMAARNPDGTFSVYDLTTGAKLWATLQGNITTQPLCDAQGMAIAHDVVYGLFSCTPPGAGRAYLTLDGYGAKSGHHVFKGNVSQIPPLDDVRLWTSPSGSGFFLVDAVARTLLAFSGNSPTGVSINLHSYGYAPFAMANQGQMFPHSVAAFGNTLYVQGENSKSGTPVAAVDLTTGKTLWNRSIPNTSTTIISADASGLHALIAQGGTSHVQLVTYSPTTGSVTNGNSMTDGRIIITADEEMYLENGYLAYVAMTTLKGFPEVLAISGTGVS